MLIGQSTISQDFQIKLKTDTRQSFPISGENTELIDDGLNQLSSIFLVARNDPPEDNPFVVTIEGFNATFEINSANTPVEITVPGLDDLNGSIIIISQGDNILVKTQISLITNKGSGFSGTDENPSVQSPFKTPEDIVQKLFPGLTYISRVGSFIQADNPNTKFGGSQYVHIFLDDNGDPILTSIPQGSPDKTYVVHVVNSIEESQFPNIRYSVKQTEGEIGDQLLFRNSGELDEFEITSTTNYIYYHYEISLRESNKNIVFEVNRGVTNNGSLMTTKLSTHTIPIKIYNGSFDIGLISTDLESPDFEFIGSSDDISTGVAKKSDGGNRGIITVMATFYTSPVILFEKFILKPKDKNGILIEIPDYKLTGRNFVSDHKFYQRIYPAVGLSINEQAEENIFFGFNWEAVRGASLFVGWHHGRVNTFDINVEGFEFEETIISEERFNLSTNNSWETDFAIGVNLDVLVILNLLQKGGSAN